MGGDVKLLPFDGKSQARCEDFASVPSFLINISLNAFKRVSAMEGGPEWICKRFMQRSFGEVGHTLSTLSRRQKFQDGADGLAQQ